MTRIAETADIAPATVFQYLERAKARLKPGAWDYLMGGSETETTLNRNRRALDALAFRPRILRDVSTVDTSTTLFGIKLRMPVILAPMGSIVDIIAEGATASTRAAARFGVVHMLSSSAHPGLEAVAKEVDYPKFFQLYIRGDAAWVDATIKSAVDLGFRGIALTVDHSHNSRRERDVAKAHMTASSRNPPGADQARLSWKDVERIRKNISVPLMLKGVATVEDAMLGVEHGIDGIYISNHGGRQLDHCEGSVGLVAEIVAAVGKRATVIVDGSILRGTDVVKALCLGAHAVGVGRLQGIGLAAGGETALTRILEIIETEMVSCMGLLGAKNLAELGPHLLAKADPLPHRNWIESAFPLLSEGYGSMDVGGLCLRLPGER
jgi:isopentenyl diphosphate isomerase/L-lactate dehydrogenase-like FMN-dependent dehydrogenase